MDIPGLQEKGGENKGGRRHHKSAKRVSAKTIRRTLKRLGMRPKGRLVLKVVRSRGAETKIWMVVVIVAVVVVYLFLCLAAQRVERVAALLKEL